MSPTTHQEPPPPSSNKILDQDDAKIKKSKKPSTSRHKLRDGLLKTKISNRSELMQIAKRNSLESPLLRLPPEIRNMIWGYTLRYHQLTISFGYDLSGNHRLHTVSDASMLCQTSPQSWILIKPTFALPRVCRQTYVEASALIYTLNRFDFSDLATIDRFIRSRVPGQRRLITYITVPTSYFRLYLRGFRKNFRTTFPNLKRVRVEYNGTRLRAAVPLHWAGFERLVLRRAIEDYVVQRERVRLHLEWY